VRFLLCVERVCVVCLCVVCVCDVFVGFVLLRAVCEC